LAYFKNVLVGSKARKENSLPFQKKWLYKSLYLKVDEKIGTVLLVGIKS
jgi:hypothetical protein